MNRLRKLFEKFKSELQLYLNILADPKTPRLTKFLLGAAVAYTLSPIDFIPDFIPIIGHLDDVIIVPILIYFALKSIPAFLLREHRQALESSHNSSVQK